MLATLVHLYGADRTWLARLEGGLAGDPADPVRTTPVDPAAVSEMAALRRAWVEVAADWPAALARAGDPLRTVPYRTYDGTVHRNTVADIVRHLVNHGSYHRGQVAAMLRRLGRPAPNTDLIAFTRLGGE